MGRFFYDRPFAFKKHRKREKSFAKLAVVCGVPETGARIRRKSLRFQPFQSIAAAVVAEKSDAYLDKVLVVDGYEHVERALSLGRGLVIAGGHIGCPAAVPALLARRGLIVRSIRRKEMRNQLNTAAGRFAFGGVDPLILDWEMAPVAVLKNAMKVLRENGIVYYLADGWFGNRSESAKIFGRSCSVRTGLVEVANKSQAPVLSGYAAATARQITIHFYPAIAPGTPNFIDTWTAQYASSYETELRANLAQVRWVALQKALISEPSGERELEHPDDFFSADENRG